MKQKINLSISRKIRSRDREHERDEKVYIEWHSSYLPNRPSYKESREWVDTYKHYSRDLNFFSWLTRDIPSLLPYTRSKNSMFCSEFIVMFMQTQKWVKLIHHPAWYSPQDIRENTSLVCNPGVIWTNMGVVCTQ